LQGYIPFSDPLLSSSVERRALYRGAGWGGVGWVGGGGGLIGTTTNRGVGAALYITALSSHFVLRIYIYFKSSILNFFILEFSIYISKLFLLFKYKHFSNILLDKMRHHCDLLIKNFLLFTKSTQHLQSPDPLCVSFY
jgi:hypothetical protein